MPCFPTGAWHEEALGSRLRRPVQMAAPLTKRELAVLRLLPKPRHHAGLLAPPEWVRGRVRDPLQRLVGPVRRVPPATHRRPHPVFRRRRFLVGIEAAELAWFTPAATPMTLENWADPNARALTIYLDGDDQPDLAADGTPLLDDEFLVLVNGWWDKLQFRMPDMAPPGLARRAGHRRPHARHR